MYNFSKIIIICIRCSEDAHAPAAFRKELQIFHRYIWYFRFVLVKSGISAFAYTNTKLIYFFIIRVIIG